MLDVGVNGIECHRDVAYENLPRARGGRSAEAKFHTSALGVDEKSLVLLRHVV